MDDWIIIECENKWNIIENLTNIETKKCKEMQLETERKGIEILKNEMKLYNNFYKFIKDFSPVDYKLINGKKYVSQRVIGNHFKYWNEIHSYSKLQNIRIFQL